MQNAKEKTYIWDTKHRLYIKRTLNICLQSSINVVRGPKLSTYLGPIVVLIIRRKRKCRGDIIKYYGTNVKLIKLYLGFGENIHRN